MAEEDKNDLVNVQNKMMQTMSVLVKVDNDVVSKTLLPKESLRDIRRGDMTPDMEAKISRGYFRIW